MAREDLLLAPESLEALISGFGDLAMALGPKAAAGLGGIKARLEHAVALRQDGKPDEAVAEVLAAMQGLAQLATVLDPAEAEAMKMLAGSFQSALKGGQAGHAAESVDSMRKRSGAVKKRGDEFKL
jgi:hypothetical protein